MEILVLVLIHVLLSLIDHGIKDALTKRRIKAAIEALKRRDFTTAKSQLQGVRLKLGTWQWHVVDALLKGVEQDWTGAQASLQEAINVSKGVRQKALRDLLKVFTALASGATLGKLGNLLALLSRLFV